ncbi:sensor histidine kinase [Kitasatospora viridis]|uniref:histidine kinase n=1 Tax=Kitasatospora viridis TaxID=281105 RepID=A0A561TWE5_9ACTN|nr:sensor histidine kinase [Kitasatospora viridis]TWF91435.1 signal transduction histidine kinase [Kitasatospora viridis]
MPTHWQRYLRDHPRAVDTALALLIFANAFPGSMLRNPGTAARAAWWPGVIVTGIACVALLWRRSRPLLTVVVTTVCAVPVVVLGYLLSPLLLAPVMLALYSLAARARPRTTYAVTLATVALLVGTALLAGPTGGSVELKTVGPAAWLLLAVAIGTATRLNAAYLEAVEARAEHAERTREEEARHRVSEERMRIARELHDVVAHHLALANAQANTVAHLIRSHPDQAGKIATELSGTTSSALRELKATVGLLRQGDAPDVPLEPAPGLAQLPALAASYRSAGLAVTIATEGQPRDLSPGMDLTTFRIVQEALTNVNKHADVETARVRLCYTRDRLIITVTDDGSATSGSAPGSAPGYGLIGMRERALSLGGSLRAGHRPGGGFEVVADLPIDPGNPGNPAEGSTS